MFNIELEQINVTIKTIWIWRFLKNYVNLEFQQNSQNWRFSCFSKKTVEIFFKKISRLEFYKI